LAADLPVLKAAPAYVPPPAFSWTGVYLGAAAGFAQGFHTFNDLAGGFLGYPGLTDSRSRGFAGGGILGINFQAGQFVYGIETDFSWLSNRTNYVDPNGLINNFFPSETNRLNELGTVRGRLGLAVDRTLIYFTAGFAYGNVHDGIRYNSNFFPTANTPSFNVNTTSLGWVVGTGVEYALTSNWTVKGEALYADLGSLNTSWVSPGSQTFPAGAVFGARFDTGVAVIRAGVNYKFDWFTSPGLVSARY
jgi:outer membrane immunogenic protein